MFNRILTDTEVGEESEVIKSITLVDQIRLNPKRKPKEIKEEDVSVL